MECNSCMKETSNWIKLPCPKCGNKIIRCEKCRGLSIEYTCNKCSFKGP